MAKYLSGIFSTMMICCGLALIWATAWIAAADLGNLQWFLYGGGVLLVAGVLRIRRRSAKELLAQSERMGLEAEKRQMEEARRQIELRVIQLMEREQRLNQKMMTCYEWDEIPKYQESVTTIAEDAQVREFSPKDLEVLKLLEDRTAMVYEKLQNNSYQEQGQFQNRLVLDDIVSLFEAVAGIYYPDSERPLLETDIESLLRAINRISLQLLMVFDELPLDVKKYNLKNIYDYIRKGMKAWGGYKAAEPYFSWAKPVFHIGRLALGANPLTLGAGWAASELFKEGMSQLASHKLNQYTLDFSRAVVNIIGIEAAAIYSSEFHYRNEYWVYGAELTELASRFRLSGNAVVAALQEINSLSLRSQYDRLYFYKLVSQCKPASVNGLTYQSFLSVAARQAISDKLARFAEQFIQARPKELQSWRDELENRLGVRLNLTIQCESHPMRRNEEALSSLAGFLLEIKQEQPENLKKWLTQTQVAQAITAEERERIIGKLVECPPMIFEYPDYEVADRRIQDFIKDIDWLSVSVYPYAMGGYAQAKEIAQYFRLKDEKSWRKEMDRIVCEGLTKRLLPNSPRKKAEAQTSLALLSILSPNETMLFLYNDAAITDVAINATKKNVGDIQLLETEARLALVRPGVGFEGDPDTPGEIIWTGQRHGASAVAILAQKSFWGNQNQIQGGAWLHEEFADLAERLVITVTESDMELAAQQFMMMEDCQSSK